MSKAVAALMAVVVAALLVVAYAWQPPEERDFRSSWSAESRFVDTPVARFHYTRTGNGSPVVLLPGGTLWIYTYRDTIRPRRRSHRVRGRPARIRIRIHERPRRKFRL
ncbi:hypothetical protein ACQP25_18895 [Microtetraspora malaysiensis]|uniref:hypothetical protein n=1 Tax=Microtetraspora malaysiensis TaxID=161358 RepID=UPI003D90BE86